MERVACGDNDAQIAALLGIGQQTVTQYVRSACIKLDAPNRTAAAVRYDRRYGQQVAGRLQPDRPPLSPQERQVIELAAEGIGEVQIAKQIGVSTSTVKKHLLSLRQKLGAPNRTAAAVEYYRQAGALSYMKKTGGAGEG
ncbi:helix-turn-helix transcriptional regulator [Chloroflexales bacterium ZM16-3]|nr:helix-turn-helix transcriptional regulator [Chloroflexales bacterium ZM16-3]